MVTGHSAALSLGSVPLALVTLPRGSTQPLAYTLPPPATPRPALQSFVIVIQIAQTLEALWFVHVKTFTYLYFWSSAHHFLFGILMRQQTTCFFFFMSVFAAREG